MLSPNRKKYEPEITPYLGTFHAVQIITILHQTQKTLNQTFKILHQILKILHQTFKILHQILKILHQTFSSSPNQKDQKLEIRN